MLKNYTKLLLAVLILFRFTGFSQTNYLENSSFEIWSGSPESPDNWSITNENNISKSTDATEGSFSLDLGLNNTLANQTILSTWNASSIVLAPSTNHTFTFDYKVSTQAGNNLSAYLDVRKDEGSYTIQYIHEFIPLESDGAWHTYTFSFDTEIEEDYAIELMFRANTDPASSIKVDNLQVLGPSTTISPDREALIALYNATNGDNWLNSWDLNLDASSWYGIELNTDNRVVSIKLDGNNLIGTLPSEIGDLEELKILNLNKTSFTTGDIDNDITGSIPNEISNLINLQSLLLDGLSFTGSLPSGISQLNQLREINIHGSNLTGTLPTDIGNMFSLEYLSLSRNDINGNIPESIGQLSNLKVLLLSSNNLSGNIPHTIGQLSNLRTLDLSNNNIDGEIPSEIGQISNLEILSFNINFISGMIPSELGYLSNLKQLRLGSNQLSGPIPSTFNQLINIELIYLYFNQLSGEIPDLSQLTKLSSLKLNSNNLTGTIPPFISQLTELGFLELGSNLLSGNIPSDIGNLTNLRVLFLENNDLEGNIPASISDLPILYQVKLNNNNLNGEIPILSFNGLNTYHINNNNFVFEDVKTVINEQSILTYSPQNNIEEEEIINLDVGDDFIITITETADENNLYQWRKDGDEIIGATNSTLTIPEIKNEDVGVYDCVITNIALPDLTLYRNQLALIIGNYDSDNDGVADSDDDCPNTPTGDTVDEHGCTIYENAQPEISNDDIQVKVTSTSCPNTANGEISVSFTEDYNYTVQITGILLDNTFDNLNASNGLVRSGLSSGSYTVCITIPEYPSYEQCYIVTIETPEEFISGKTVIDYTAQKARVVVSGSKNYQVLVNEKVYSFEVDNIDNQQLSFPLDKGSNIISIETDKICQGVFKDSIVLSNAILSPNPVEDMLRVEGLNMMTDAQIIVSNLSGVTSLQDNYQINYGTLEMNISNLSPGVYMLTIVDGDKEINLKFVKK